MPEPNIDLAETEANIRLVTDADGHPAVTSAAVEAGMKDHILATPTELRQAADLLEMELAERDDNRARPDGGSAGGTIR